MATGDNEGAAELVREVLQDDVARLRRVRKVLRRGLAAAILAVHGLGTVVLGWIVFARPFPYPTMYVVMGLVLWLVLAIRLAARMGKRPWMNGFMVLFNLVLNAFWIAVLLDQIPSRIIAERSSMIVRDDQTILWLPIALYVLACAGLVVRYVISMVQRAPRQ